MVRAKTKAEKVFDRTKSTATIITDKLLDELTYLVRTTDYSRKKVPEVDRKKEIFKIFRNEKTYEVTTVSDITLDDYENITPASDWNKLLKWAKSMTGKTVVFINPTMEGGGVAMLRPPLVHLLQLLGVNARWYVMSGRKNPTDPNPFLFTKQMHNISQRRAPKNERITKSGKAIHQAWNAENAEILIQQETIRIADVIVIDDPQPAPLKKHIDKVNHKVKWVWRNHIDTNNELMSDPSTPQGEVSGYILNECGIKDVDAVVAHPVESFVHPGMEEKTFFAPATIEPHDDLNKALTDQEIKDGITFINSEIINRNKQFSTDGDKRNMQRMIDPSRPKISLVARFDESKGMDKALELGVRTREKIRQLGMNSDKYLPQVIIIGNGSVDDPSGIPVYEEMLKIRREKYPKERKDIIIMRLRHNYKAMNALMYPTPSRSGKRSPQMVALQTSEAEGCETRISDWIRHGVPVVISNRGGMSLQVEEGKSGLVIDFDKPDFDIERGAEFIANIITDHNKYSKIRKSTLEAAEKFNNREFTTTANATRLLRVFDSVLKGKKADYIWKISEMKD